MASGFLCIRSRLQWSCFREIPALSKKEIVERGHQAFFADYAEIERGLQTKRSNTRAPAGPRSRQ